MKKTKGEKIFNIFNMLLMILICIVSIYPYLNQLALSLNDGNDAMRGGIYLLPRKFTLENYRLVFTNESMLSAAVISVLRVFIGTVLSLLLTFSAAFGLTRQNLLGKRGLTLYFMIPAYISAGVIPTYFCFRYTHLINSFWVYVLPTAFTFYNMVIIRSFLQELPVSIEESAKLDGANDILIMFRIAIPLSKAVIATVALWVAVAQWNDWTTTLMYVTKQALYPLQYIMMRLIKEASLAEQMSKSGNNTGTSVTTPETVKAATLIVTTIPIIMVYPFVQKYFIAGVTVGAVKG